MKIYFQNNWQYIWKEDVCVGVLSFGKDYSDYYIVFFNFQITVRFK